ncbi:hypothetical protein DPMN_134110 [Dreissena polymorpha]|uniref:Uncharacterized protein n=1 Tax=Dreissena polymorpha TaxID=45954 RepID=A0A9D4JBG9_DREPO|nr:hypothetical protein DPMN_133945 [Dreissena polymorpha]KAH3805802.1 hypothetical protein DPMN_134110 [Dreissena polymorpha]
MSDTRPPSYSAVASMRARSLGDVWSTGDHDQTSVHGANIPTVSRLSLRRRNTVAVVLVAVGLLATVAAISGLVLHFLNPKGERRVVNVY